MLASRKFRRLFTRSALAILILNELRGIAMVALMWPLWWPVVLAAFHLARGG